MSDLPEFVPVSAVDYDGFVPAGLGGTVGFDGMVNGRPMVGEGFVPATSYEPWRPDPNDDAKLPCALLTKKGKVCQMARAYTVEGDPTSKLTPYCKAHWTAILSACNHALMGAHIALTSPPPD